MFLMVPAWRDRPAARLVRLLCGLAAALMMLSLWPSISAAQAPVDCTTADFAKTYALDPGFLCAEIRSATYVPNGTTISARLLRDQGDARSLQYEPYVSDAVEKSLAVFGGFAELRFPDVTLLFMDPSRVSKHESYADTQMLANGECLVRIYAWTIDAAGKGDVLLHLQSSIAHELFHCIQQKTWPAQFHASPTDPDWWIEGSATLMGFVVFEHPELFRVRVNQFWKDRDTPMTRQTYGNVVFFSWLWNRNPQSVMTLIGKMPTQPGELYQQNALANAVGADNLSLFARDLLDGRIRGPGDKATPVIVDPTEPADVVTATDKRTYAAIPFTVFHQDVSFRNGNYMFMAQGNRFASYRRADKSGEEWRDMGFEVTEGLCSVPKTYRFAGMSVDGGDVEEFSLNIEKMPGECAPCMAQEVRDACVAGQWRITNASIADSTMANNDGSLTDVFVRGVAGMWARGDGTHLFGFENLQVEGVPSAGWAGTFRILLHGTIDSTWSAADGRMKLCYADADAHLLLQTFGGTGDPISIKEMVELGGQTTQWWDYTCAGDRLTISGMADTVRFKLDMDKVGPP